MICSSGIAPQHSACCLIGACCNVCHSKPQSVRTSSRTGCRLFQFAEGFKGWAKVKRSADRTGKIKQTILDAVGVCAIHSLQHAVKARAGGAKGDEIQTMPIHRPVWHTPAGNLPFPPAPTQ